MSFWYTDDNTNNYFARNNTASGKKESYDQQEIRTERAEGGVTGKSASTKPVAVTLEILADRKQRLLLARKCALYHGDHTVRSR